MDNRPISFKTSVSGFNKQDVINYIELINNQYRKMEASYKQEIEQLRNNNDPTDYNKIIDDLKAENDELKKQITEIDPNPYREKAELYDKMSSQLGSIIIMANEKADDIINTTNDKVSDAKHNINKQIDMLNKQLYNEFLLAVESYSDEFKEFNKSIAEILNTLNDKSEQIKNKYDKKNLELKQSLMNEVNKMKLFNGENEKI